MQLKGIPVDELDREHCDLGVQERAMLMALDPRLRPSGLKRLPDEYRVLKAWPLRALRARIMTANQFRFMCWRSLQPRFLGGTTHELLTMRRLNDIYFGRCEEFPTLDALSFVDVVIMELTPALKSESNGLVICELIQERVGRHNKGLWFYQPLAGNALTAMYGEYLEKALARIPEVTTVSAVVPESVPESAI